MKAFTIAAALDAGAIDLHTTCVDDNNLRIAGVRIQNADRYTIPVRQWRDHGRRRAEAVEQRRRRQDRPAPGQAAPVRGASSASASGRRPASTSPGEASGVVWNPDGPNAHGRPDRRAERLRPGAQRHGRAAGRRLCRDRQRRDAGDAARHRRLDRRRTASTTPPSVQPGERVMREATATRWSGSSPRRSTTASPSPPRSPATRSRARPARPRSPAPRPSRSGSGPMPRASRSTRRVTRLVYSTAGSTPRSSRSCRPAIRSS